MAIATHIFLNLKKVAIVGIVRDVEETILEDYQKLKHSLSIFGGIKWFLVESDSSDNSLQSLSEIRKSNSDFDFVSLGKIRELGVSRTVAMAKSRNRYLLELRENERFTDIDFVVVADFNGLNNLISLDSVISCFERDDWDACFANQSKRYYDIWALRHDLWSPNDCWRQHEFLRKYINFPEFALYVSVQSRMIHIPKDSEWIEVESAFGGFAIYRRNVLDDVNYFGISVDGEPICEHVPLNLSLNAMGYKLMINPKLINADTTDHSKNSNLFSLLIRLLKYPAKLLRVSFNR